MPSPTRLKETGRTRRVQLDALLPDAKNRELRAAKVEKIAREFDFGKWSPPVAREGENGSITLIDGHHRVAAGCKAGLGSVDIIVYVHPPVETDARVGEMYVGINTTTKSTPTENFLQRVRAQERTPLQICRLVDAAGFDGITPRPTVGSIHSASALEWIYRGGWKRGHGEHAEVLAGTLVAVVGAYGRTTDAVRPDVLKGFGSFLHRYPQVIPEELARKVREHSDTDDVRELLRQAKAMRDALRCDMHQATALVLRRAYNKGRSSGKLPEWSSAHIALVGRAAA